MKLLDVIYTFTIFIALSDIFLFVNPKSGARKGRDILKHEFTKIQFELKEGLEVVMHIADLTDAEKRTKHLREMRAI